MLGRFNVTGRGGARKLSSYKVKIQTTIAFEVTHIYFYSLGVFLANSLETSLHLLSIFVNVDLKKVICTDLPTCVYHIPCMIATTHNKVNGGNYFTGVSEATLG